MYICRAIVNTKSIYVQDNVSFRVFLAREDVFPPYSIGSVPAGHLTVFVPPDPTPTPLTVPQMPFPLPPKGKMETSIPAKSSRIHRPPNAFILYRKAHHQAVKAAHPGIHNNQICEFLFLTPVTHINIFTAVILGTQWQQEDAEVIAQYRAQAAQLKQEHMAKYPDYQYKPRKASEVKRRMTKKAKAMSRGEIIKEPGKSSGISETAIFAHVHDHNAVQHQFAPPNDERLHQVSTGDNLYRYSNLPPSDKCAIPWEAIKDRLYTQDGFDEFINPQMWARAN